MLLSASFLLCVSSVGANYAQQINLTSGEEDVVLKTKKNNRFSQHLCQCTQKLKCTDIF